MYRIADEIVLYEEGDKKYLVNSVTGKVYMLNEMAAKIIEGLETDKNLNEIKEIISVQFPDIPIEQIGVDVDNYIKILIDSRSIIKNNKVEL